MKLRLRTILRVVIAIVFVYLLYRAGLPWPYILGFALILIASFALRGHLYRKIDHYLKHFFPSIKKLPSWVEKVIIVVVFILIYLVLKEAIYAILKAAGFDIEGAVASSINQSFSS